MGDDGLRFFVLGRVSARYDGVEVDLGSPQQRATLAVLLLGDGRRASVDSLVDALWGPVAPPTAPAVIRTYVSRLRAALGASGPSVIETTGRGYALSAVRLDLDEFRAGVSRARNLAAQGDLPRAVAVLRQGLALWSGEPLEGVDVPFADRHRTILEELRLAALEECLALEVSSGAHREAAVELSVLMDRNPLRERLRELFMLALYRSGRRTEALEAYDAGRRLLADELGIDPGPGLREVHRRVLADDRRLLPTPESGADGRPGQVAGSWTSPSQLPPMLPFFTGRAEELARLDALLEDSAVEPNTTALIAIDGMSGVGKTTLALRWAHRVANRFPDGRLHLDLRGFGGDGPAMSPAEALHALLVALGVPGDGVPEGLAARTGLYRSLLTGRRVLVVLDNVPAAQDVGPLLPGDGGSCVVVTSRTCLAGLVASHGARLLSLGLPSRADARALFVGRVGPERAGREPEAVDAIVAGCGRLPQALVAVAAHLVSRASFPLARMAAELPTGPSGASELGHRYDGALRDSFSWSFDRLSTPARHLLALLARRGDAEFSRSTAAALSGEAEETAGLLLAELAEAQLLTEYRPGHHRLHALVRVYAVEHGRGSGRPRRDRSAAFPRTVGGVGSVASR
ncbi:BTAD domain-containing putative transcriptional regulator [Streptomyces sp. 4N124]|uniref:BTAD domain-containing putative transcriptional regulator n=1 Tax=Streptomyces sp. 4N124 TaxID=3457420 RepID=UPI003FD39424